MPHEFPDGVYKMSPGDPLYEETMRLAARNAACNRVQQLDDLMREVEKETGGLPNRGAAHAFALYGAMITLTQIFLHFDENALDLLLQSIATLIDIETESYSKERKDSIIALLKQKEE